MPDDYNTLIEKYRRKYILWCDGEIIFADSSSEIVVERLIELRKVQPEADYKFEYIDDSEAIYHL